MLFENNKDKGRAGISFAIAYFGANGYTVNIPLNDTQWYDLVVEKDGIFQTVQCKATGTLDGRIDFRSCGGTKGEMYDFVREHPIDLLFCLNKKQDMFLIPLKEIPSELKGIYLKTEPNKNGGGFETYKYLIKF
jgi:hypothetical protein